MPPWVYLAPMLAAVSSWLRVNRVALPGGISLGSGPPLSLGEGRVSSLLRGVSVTVRREEEEQDPPVELGDRKKKIGWDASLFKAQGVVGRLKTETQDGNFRKGKRRKRKRNSSQKPSFLLLFSLK